MRDHAHTRVSGRARRAASGNYARALRFSACRRYQVRLDIWSLSQGARASMVLARSSMAGLFSGRVSLRRCRFLSFADRQCQVGAKQGERADVDQHKPHGGGQDVGSGRALADLAAAEHPGSGPPR